MKRSNSIVKVLLLGIVVFIAAAGGMYLGGRFNNHGEAVPEVSADIFQQLKLQTGATFPKVDLLDRAFNSVPFENVLDSKGTVILFMDPHCSPCKDQATYWQSLIDQGDLDTNQVVGICFFNASQIEEIYLDNEISFPIYADENYTFYDKYGVDAFPLTLIVDKDGVITYSESNSNIKPTYDELKKFFSGK